jgi:hypothetical protein
MPPRFSADSLADLRRDAQRLIERAHEHAAALEAMVVATERDSREAKAAAAHPGDLGTEIRDLLSRQLERSSHTPASPSGRPPTGSRP